MGDHLIEHQFALKYRLIYFDMSILKWFDPVLLPVRIYRPGHGEIENSASKFQGGRLTSPILSQTGIGLDMDGKMR